MGWFKPTICFFRQGYVGWLGWQHGSGECQTSESSASCQPTAIHYKAHRPIPSCWCALAFPVEGSQGRMVKQAVGLLKHIRAGFDGFVELAEDWTEKWPLFLISASQQSQDLRSHPFSHLRISGSFLFFRKEPVILCYTLHPGKSISLYKADTILWEFFTGNQSQVQLAEQHDWSTPGQNHEGRGQL